MKYFIYSRVSTNEQEVETQIRMCKEKVQSWHPDGKYTIKIFSDANVSSGICMKNRVALQEMLNSITPDVTVLVYKLDRLSRDIIEMVTIYRLIVDKYKAKVISLNDPYSDEFSVGLMGLIAQKERETIRMRTRDTLATKKKNGERYCGKIPYGYTMHKTHMVPIRKGKDVTYKLGVLVPLAEEQEVIERMREYFDRGMSYQQIAYALTVLGYRNREGNPFHKMSIYRILSRTGRTKSVDQPLEALEFQTSH